MTTSRKLLRTGIGESAVRVVSAKGSRLVLDDGREVIDAMLRARGVRPVAWADWKRLDRIERERGTARGKIRDKFTRVEDMLAALEARDTEAPFR